MSINFLALIATAGVAVLVAVLLLQQRRTPQSTLAWLMAVVLLPHVAVPLFLVLGFRKRGFGFKPIQYTTVAEDRAVASPLDRLFRQFDLPGATEGNRITLLADGVECWNEMTELVRSAEREIDVIFYLVADDDVGRSFVELLAERARAGIRVRMMVDWLGGFRGPNRALRDLRAAGGQIRYFSPLLHLPERGHVNLRNHRKMIMVDRGAVFAGGRNMGRHYMGPTEFSDRWVDLSYLLRGPAVLSFVDVFRSDWNMGRKNGDSPGEETPTAPVGQSVAQLVPSGPDCRFDPLHDALVNAIHSAQRRVWVATPYFIPTEHLEHALATAARRGLDVRIMLPRRSNQRSADLARGIYIRTLQSAGARILLLEDGMMHAKTGLIDSAGWVGSANFDVRSMLLNFESTLVVYDPPTVARLSEWFEAVQSRCCEGAPQVGVIRRSVEGLFRLGAPML